MAVKKVQNLALPENKPTCTRWVILGLDPSLSSSGLALMLVDHEAKDYRWLNVGSVEPGSTQELAWIRARAMGQYITELLGSEIVREFCQESPTGFLLSYEAPTPGNDHLATASICIRASLRADSLAMDQFSEHWELMTNAATMRNIMGLKEKGNNKWENKDKAWEFLGKEGFPNLDSDACDGVLFTMLGLWSTQLFHGGVDVETVPEVFRVRFCDTTEDYKVVTKTLEGKVVPKGKKKGLSKDEATKERVVTGLHGVLHNPNYWFPYVYQTREVAVRDARSKKGARLTPKKYLV